MLLLEECSCDLSNLIYPAALGDKLMPEQIMSIARQMVKGLAYLHSHSVKHLDLKPGNVLVVIYDQTGAFVNSPSCTAKYGVRIADFGMNNESANHSDSRASDEVDTNHYGTYEYMSPECYSRKFGEPCSASDVFSFALVLWELYSGQRIYSAWWPDDDQAPTVTSKDGKPSVNVELIAKRMAGVDNTPERPAMPTEVEFPVVMDKLICACWEADMRIRPTFLQIEQCLQRMESCRLHEATSFDDWLKDLAIQDKKQQLHDYDIIDIRDGQDPLRKLVEMYTEEPEDFEDMVKDLFCRSIDLRAVWNEPDFRQQLAKLRRRCSAQQLSRDRATPGKQRKPSITREQMSLLRDLDMAIGTGEMDKAHQLLAKLESCGLSPGVLRSVARKFRATVATLAKPEAEPEQLEEEAINTAWLELCELLAVKDTAVLEAGKHEDVRRLRLNVNLDEASMADVEAIVAEKDDEIARLHVGMARLTAGHRAA